MTAVAIGSRVMVTEAPVPPDQEDHPDIVRVGDWATVVMVAGDPGALFVRTGDGRFMWITGWEAKP